MHHRNKFRMACVALASVATGHAQADTCFTAKGDLGADAQEIRQQAASMGWSVGKPASLAASTVVKGKVKLYPKGSVEICLKPGATNDLLIKEQASSSDAGKAEWRQLPAKKT